MENSVRPPIVAGAFYPAHPDRLREAIASSFPTGLPETRGDLSTPIGLIAPHAGYPYSGAVAAAGYERVARLGKPSLAILLGANHTGMGDPISLAGHTTWETPLGRSPVATDAVRRLQDAGLSVSDAAFRREHSLEVQLPFLQALWGVDLPIVPVCVSSTPLPPVGQASAAIAKLIADRGALIVASSDFTHYEPDATARELDGAALDAIRALDANRFERLYREQRLSICGAGAILMLLDICNRLGLTDADEIRYATSGDVTGERSAVVGYASVVFSAGTR